MKRLLLSLLASGALVLLCEPVAAQTFQLPTDLAAATANAIRAEIALARDAGLPDQPLILKVLEGRSKGATDAQVINAVIALRKRLAIASTIFGKDAGSDLLVAGAAALYAGVGTNTLSEIARSPNTEARGTALVVLGDLVRKGVPIANAERAVLSLSAAGADNAALNEFRRNVDDDIRIGQTPSRAAEVRLKGMLARVGGKR